MSQNTILMLQSVGVTAQMINAGIATTTHNLLLALIFSSVVGGFQYYLQHVGNQTTPPSTPGSK